MEEARRFSARSVNAVMAATYWEIGRRIVEFEQEGKAKAAYGGAFYEAEAIRGSWSVRQLDRQISTL